MKRDAIQRAGAWAWWTGVPVIVGVLTWGPYLLMNVSDRTAWPFWRVPVLPIVLYDSSAYFEWIGAALAGVPFGSHIGPFAALFQIVGRIMPPSTTVAEVWLFTLWVCTAACLWLLAPMFAAWSGLSRTNARWIAVFCWSSLVLPYLPRPGVFTWYLPFFAFAVFAAWHTNRALTQNAWGGALAWSVASLLVSTVYPFFLFPLLLWLLVLWIIHSHEHSPRLTRIIGFMTIIGTAMVIPFITPWLITPETQQWFTFQERLGVSFTRLPVLSNSLLAAIAWVAFIATFSWARRERPDVSHRMLPLLIGWLTLIGAWLSNIFTAVYFHQDHFRAPVVMLSWVSLVVVWGDIQMHHLERADPSKRIRARGIRSVFFGIGVFALILFGWTVFGKAYVFQNDHLNAVHASQWLVLAAASVGVWTMEQGRWSLQTALRILGIIAILLGGAGRLHAYRLEQRAGSVSMPFAPVVLWIQAHVPRQEGICTDPRSAEHIGSFSGRLTYPTYATLFLPKTEKEILADLRTLRSAYHVETASDIEAYVNTFDSMRGTTCAQFQPFRRLATFFNVSSEMFNATAGCPQQQVEQNRIMLRGLTVGDEDRARFPVRCPTVIIDATTASQWALPPNYSEERITERFSAWRPTP